MTLARTARVAQVTLLVVAAAVATADRRVVTSSLQATPPQAAAPPAQLDPWPREPEEPTAPKPRAPSPGWLGFIGEYGDGRFDGSGHLSVLERDGKLWAFFGRSEPAQLDEISTNVFTFAAGGPHEGQVLAFTRGAGGRASRVTVGDVAYARAQVGPEEGVGQLRVTPLRPVADLLEEARTAEPPKESGTFRPSALVELTVLDPSIRLDIRYATTNNFLGSVFYAQARAFLQRPAAEAVVRVGQALKPLGYGLLVHDGYRPWYVTKTFWDATPGDKKWLVADPANGSRHNRGAAVDLTLYDLETGLVVEMPSTYDESTPRAYAFYPGGTSLQRWHRALLRRLMEREGFMVNPEEWWHFDYEDWRSYAIGNVPFEQIR